MNKNFIFKNKIPTNNRPCIYFLIHEDAIVYVGSTTRLMERLGTHARHKTFSHYWYYECTVDQMIELEVQEIVKHNPELNRNLPPNPWYESIEQFKKIYELNKREVKKIMTEQQMEPVFRKYYDASLFRRGLALRNQKR